MQRRDLRADVVALFGKDVAAGAECLSAGPDERQERANLLERKTAEFQVLDDRKRCNIVVCVRSLPIAGARTERQQPLLFIVAQGRWGNIHHACHFSDCIRHTKISLKNC